MISVNTAFDQRLRTARVDGIVEIIDMVAPGIQRYWTSCNQEIYATTSGTLREYIPLRGQASGSIESATDMTVATMEFTLSVTSDTVLRDLLNANQLDAAEITIHRVFADTPGLGRMPVYRGNLGTLGWNRQALRGQARNAFDSAGVQFPYYTYSDGCVWRFGSVGCGVSTSSFAVTVPASNVVVASCSRTSVFLSVQSEASGYFDLGRLTFLNGVNSGVVRTIREHAGRALRLSHDIPNNVASGDSFSIFPGCRKRFVADCTSKYNNANAFVGFFIAPVPEDLQLG